MLIDIINNVREVVGINPTDTAAREQLLNYINRAGRELYDSMDLPNTLREDQFCLDDDHAHITLPWYVDGIRGIRHVASGCTFQLLDPRSQYSYTEIQQPCDTWRFIRKSPLIRDIPAAGTLTITLTEAQPEALQVAVSGQTTQAFLAIETVTFAAGETSKTTTKQFTQENPTGITSITKNRVTSVDVIVTDTASGAEIARIPNRHFAATNQIIQIYAPGHARQYDDDCFQILYKLPYQSLWYDNDSFFDPKLEEALVWKSQEHFYARQGDPEKANIAMLAAVKCTDSLMRVAQNQESQQVRIIQTDRNPYELRLIPNVYSR
jgi:hypothetical protein